MDLKALSLQLGLEPGEFQSICQLLEREPEPLELHLFAAMWSEHCSYKSSRRWLKTLPREGEFVLAGPGDSAGVVKIDERWSAAFKIESHNHPSAVEPFQGAATGVGGIIRDIISTGARPIGILDNLRFGPLSDRRNRYLFRRVVEGIAHYGNCIGVPTVGGDVEFAEPYSENPLVNVMAVGVLDNSSPVRGIARGEGSLLVLYGSATGREGLGGATFASRDLEPEKREEDRFSVQIANPFLEKLLIEATVQLASESYLVGVQDLGAAGLLCASSEMALRGDSGVELFLDRVHLREKEMEPYEILLSETQERMLCCIRPEGLPLLQKILERWEVPYSVVGRVTSDGRYRVFWRGEEIVDLPVNYLADSAPEYDLPKSPRPSISRSFPEVGPEALRRALSAPNRSSRRWIYSQYDFMVGVRTVRGPGEGNAAVLKLNPSPAVLGVASAGIPLHYRGASPRLGAMAMVLTAVRKLIASGIEPLAATNCLNFASPKDPGVYWEFVQVISGMGEICRRYRIPITGGNVSFYNQTESSQIPPTPIFGLLGRGRDWKAVPLSHFQFPGERVFSAGPFFLPEEPPPLELCLATDRAVSSAISDGLVSSVRAVTRDLWDSLIKAAFGAGGGFRSSLSAGELLRPGGHRYLLTVSEKKSKELVRLFELKGIPFREVGVTGGDELLAESFRIKVGEAVELWDSAFSAL